MKHHRIHLSYKAAWASSDSLNKEADGESKAIVSHPDPANIWQWNVWQVLSFPICCCLSQTSLILINRSEIGFTAIYANQNNHIFGET